MNRTLVAIVAAAWVSGLACAPVSAADPLGPIPGPNPDPAENQAALEPLAAPEDSGNSLADACRRFNAALNVAAVNYEDFAYATAGNGKSVNYQDPDVLRTNVIGRTALRRAAAEAMSASRTPGLPPEVADPMQDWSLHATKLLLVMGLHGGGDTLNSSVAELNVIGNNAQMACVTSGPRL